MLGRAPACAVVCASVAELSWRTSGIGASDHVPNCAHDCAHEGL